MLRTVAQQCHNVADRQGLPELLTRPGLSKADSILCTEFNLNSIKTNHRSVSIFPTTSFQDFSLRFLCFVASWAVSVERLPLPFLMKEHINDFVLTLKISLLLDASSGGRMKRGMFSNQKCSFNNWWCFIITKYFLLSECRLELE